MVRFYPGVNSRAELITLPELITLNLCRAHGNEKQIVES
jgi:hypothetical protein